MWVSAAKFLGLKKRLLDLENLPTTIQVSYLTERVTDLERKLRALMACMDAETYAKYARNHNQELAAETGKAL